MTDTDYQLRVRIPLSLKEMLDESASFAKRTLTSEVKIRLEESFATMSEREHDFFSNLDQMMSLAFSQEETIKSQQATIAHLTQTIAFLSKKTKTTNKG